MPRKINLAGNNMSLDRVGFNEAEATCLGKLRNRPWQLSSGNTSFNEAEATCLGKLLGLIDVVTQYVAFNGLQ